jgi:hypothetical protein
MSASGRDYHFSHYDWFEDSSIHIFLSYIFLSAKPKQENVGEENKSGLFQSLAEKMIKAGESLSSATPAIIASQETRK